jgi:uncharacterized protein (PEP-CTERM system associated)
LTAFVSLGPLVFVPEDGDAQVFANWQLELDGSLLKSRYLTLTVFTRQGFDDTTTEVDNVGIVLRQSLGLRLNYAASRRLRTSFEAEYVRTEFLETTGGENAVQGREENLWSTRASASYALTRILSLTVLYEYQQRESNVEDSDFYENRLTITLSAGFPVF